VQTVSVADDFGEMVHAMFLEPLRWAGCTVPCMSDSFSYEDMVGAFGEGKGVIQSSNHGMALPVYRINKLTWRGLFVLIVTGKKARYIPMDSYRDFPTHGSTVLAELQDVYRYMQSANGWFFGKPDDVETYYRQSFWVLPQPA
jgi:hypothetical protein